MFKEKIARERKDEGTGIKDKKKLIYHFMCLCYIIYNNRFNCLKKNLS